MLRYLVLYGHFVRFSTSKAFEFRVDFFFRIFMDLIYYGVNIVFYQVVFLQTPLLGGWTRDQSLIFLAGYLVVDALTMTIFSNNLWWFPVAVNRGDLDYYLVRPVSALFFLLLRDFAANSFLNLLFALGILTWALVRAHMEMHGLDIAAYLLLLALGAWLHALMHLLVVLPVFWTQSGSSLHGIFYNLVRFMERPDRIYTGWVRKLLVTALPFCLMASFPARMFLEGFAWRLMAHFALVVAGFTVMVLSLWKIGLRSYASASS